ncbi:MAG: tetratricopeptide repeat protein [Anaerolineae bacterium]|nr:tetratricopeptide repeat protein [Anaerolineae bacterium]
MSSTPINSILSQAYALIEADQHEQAADLLKPLLAEHSNNADAWWLYAHAVTDIDDAHAALQTVLLLDPQYPAAQNLMEQLEEASRGAGNPLVDMELQPIRAIPDVPEALPEIEPMSDIEREMAYGDVTERRQGMPDWLRIVGLALIFLAAIVGALLLSQSALAPGNEGTLSQEDLERTATQIVAEATGTAVALSLPLSDADIQATATQMVADATTMAGQAGIDPLLLTATKMVADATLTAEGVSGQGGGEDLALTATAIMAQAQGQVPTQEIDEAARAEALAPLRSAFQSEFGETADVTVGNTKRGDTLIIRLCSEEPGVLLRATLERAMDVLANQGNLMQFGANALGIRLVSCAAPDTEYRLLTATMTDVQGYMSGIFDAEVFQARLSAE